MNYFIYSKFLNHYIKKGKKDLTYNVLKKIFLKKKYLLKQKKNNSYLNIIIKRNLPQIGLNKKKISRKIYNFPKIITIENRFNLLLKWIFDFFKKNSKKNLVTTLNFNILYILKSKSTINTYKRQFYDLLQKDRPFLKKLEKRKYHNFYE